MADDNRLPIHFFTIVLNGEPFIRYHLKRMKALSCRWHWHVVEGLADLKHDTAWSLSFGASIPPDVARDGRSVDGTAEYLDQIAEENRGQITIYRAPNGRMWDGKLEMVAAPLVNLREECLLWEIDSDELWTTEQFTTLRELFLRFPDRTAAVFYCWYFVGPDLAINRKRRYPEIEWRRAWRFRPGMQWAAHEPPVLAAPVQAPGGAVQYMDLMRQRPFTPVEMEQQGLVFQHFAYVVEAQLTFKEKYYGYQGITEQWKRLQEHHDFPVPLKIYFNWPWVDKGALVDHLDTCGILPLAHVKEDRWLMGEPTPPWAGVSDANVSFEKDRYITGWKLGYHLLPRVISRFGLKVGAEIGVALAGHSHAILARTGVQRLYGIDSYRHRPDYQDIMNLPQATFDVLHSNVLKYMDQHGERFKLLRMASVEAAAHITEPLDFVYIDAEHSYDAVKQDLETWFPKVREGGIVSGHDYNHPNFPGVGQAIREFMTREKLAIHAEEEFFWWVEKIPMEQRRASAVVQKRGIIYIQRGAERGLIERSIRSIQALHPELPAHILQMPDGGTLDKAALFAASPFDESLFLDSDAVVLDRLDFGFEMAGRHGLACCMAECPWARRNPGVQGDLVEYSASVLFFSPKAKGLFNAWAALEASRPGIRFVDPRSQAGLLSAAEQTSFSLAMAQCAVPPFILPFNWNFQPQWNRSWWGPIKVWRDQSDPPEGILNWNKVQAPAESIIQYVSFKA